MTADEISSVSSSKDTCRHTLEPVRGVEERAFAGLLQKAVDTQSSSPDLRNYIQNFKDEYQRNLTENSYRMNSFTYHNISKLLASLE